MQKILSISVAAYNMEKLIRQNLDSFVHSAVAKDVEVLVIDDGSKDSTAEIVREYERKYPDTVRLIQQENAGPGSTVNRGMEHATGKYFRMVDADDWVGEGFDLFVQTLKTIDVDMVLSDYMMVDDKTSEQRLCRVQGIPAGQVLNFEDVCASLSLAMHCTTFRTELLQTNNIRLFNGFYTDMQYLMFPTPYVKTIYYADCTVYMYRVSLSGQSMSAASMQRNWKMHDDMLFSLVKLYQDYVAMPSFCQNVADYIAARTASLAGTEMGTLLSFEPNGENKKRLYDFLKRLQDGPSDIYRRFARLKTARALLFGHGILYRQLSILHRKRLGIQ